MMTPEPSHNTKSYGPVVTKYPDGDLHTQVNVITQYCDDGEALHNFHTELKMDFLNNTRYELLDLKISPDSGGYFVFILYRDHTADKIDFWNDD